MRGHALLRFVAEPARDEDTPSSGHPVVASAEPGERWLYCYPDDHMAEY